MKILNKISQKTTSAIVALMLGAIITFAAAIDSFGVTNDNSINIENNLYEMEMLDRAYTDSFEEEEMLDIKFEEVRTIKIFDNNDELLEVIELGEGDVIENDEAQNLLNRAEFLSEYNNTSIYKILI